jgi:hypothetical protein
MSNQPPFGQGYNQQGFNNGFDQDLDQQGLNSDFDQQDLGQTSQGQPTTTAAAATTEWWQQSKDFYILSAIVIALLFVSITLLACWWCQYRKLTEAAPENGESQQKPIDLPSPTDTQSLSTASKFDSVKVSKASQTKMNKRTLGRDEEEDDMDMWSFSVVSRRL